MSTLRMKGQRITSLEEFRKNFDFANARDYLYQGRLSAWFQEIGEPDIAKELDELKKTDYSDKTLMDNFIGIFSLPVRPASAAAPQPQKTKSYSAKITEIRKKLEGKNEPGAFAVPRNRQLTLELLELLHDYFRQWSASLRREPGKKVSGNRNELKLTDMEEYIPFARCISLLDRLTRKRGGKCLEELFRLPSSMDWTTVSRPEQIEKTKIIAAYSVCFFELEYRLHLPNALPENALPQTEKTEEVISKVFNFGT